MIFKVLNSIFSQGNNASLIELYETVAKNGKYGKVVTLTHCENGCVIGYLAFD